MDGSTNAAIERVRVNEGKTSGFYSGLSCSYMNNSRIEDLVISGNTGAGVVLYGNHSGQCNGNALTGLIISDNESNGIYIYGYSGQCNENTITDCIITGNGSDGIASSSRLGECNGNIFSDRTVNGNKGDGVNLSGFLGQCSENILTDCNISRNGDDGIFLSGYQGQCTGNRIQGNTISRNAGNAGFFATNTGGNRIERNSVWGATGTGTGTGYIWGIRTHASQNNLILQNSCGGYGTNYDLDSSDTAGPIVSASGFLSAVGNTSHPWANFSH